MEYIRTPKIEDVRLCNNHSRKQTNGTLYLTATHLIFVDSAHKNEMWLVHTQIQNMEKLSIKQNGSPLRIRCKNFQVLVFLIKQERDCHDLYSSLLKLSKPVRMNELYAFSYNPHEGQLQPDGWDLFSLYNDYLQMGLPTRYWKISKVNDEFGLCETYPRLLCVPSLATLAIMTGSASFRCKRRLPVLSYLHKNGAVIVRCSQPMSGFNSRSYEDELFVDLIRRSKPRESDFLYIIDTRPMINAMANRAQGKGYENKDFYENIKYNFIGIENIHVMRNSLNKLLDACQDSSISMSSWLEAVNGSGWLKHVYNVIQVSRFIANAVGVEKRSVLVHCSDGWDRTAQTCALASIMLNPHYRTIDGFLTLIQKEWLHFGHKFEQRCGHLDGDSKEVSPVFTQFIDAVWQLMRLRPTSFQFNEELLFDLNDHAYSCQFGTFLGNCAKDRQDNHLAKKTYSLWAWMMRRTNLYLNPLYKAAHELKQDEIFLPPQTPQFVQFWLGMYHRFDKDLQKRETLADAAKALNEKANKLSNIVIDVKKQRNKILLKLGREIPDDEIDPSSNTTGEPNAVPRLSKDCYSVTEFPRSVSSGSVLKLDETSRSPSIRRNTSATIQSSPNLISYAEENFNPAKNRLESKSEPKPLTVTFSANALLDDETVSNDLLDDVLQPQKVDSGSQQLVENEIFLGSGSN